MIKEVLRRPSEPVEETGQVRISTDSMEYWSCALVLAKKLLELH